MGSLSYLLLTIGVFTAIITTTMAIVCMPDQCSRMHCPMASQDACLARGEPGRYEYEPNGGFCGCCSNCVRILRKFLVCLIIHNNDSFFLHFYQQRKMNRAPPHLFMACHQVKDVLQVLAVVRKLVYV